MKKLRRRGLRAEGQVLGTRKPAQRICALAGELGAGAIVMGADRAARAADRRDDVVARAPSDQAAGEGARPPCDRWTSPDT